MNFNDYQQAALKTADLDKHSELFHLVLGLMGESGETAEKFKKIVRDHDSDESKIDIEDVKKELGDVLWHTAVLSAYLDIKLDDVATMNLAKLADRQARGRLSGSGDNR